LDAVGHLLLGNQLLARAVAAALGAHLVLDVHGGGAELDQRARGARHVERAGAEAGVDVDQQRQVAHVGDAPDVGEHVVEVGDAEVRHAERAGGHAAAGKIDCAIADALRHQRVVRVDGADDLERLFLPERFPELLPGAHEKSCFTLSRSSCSSLSVASIRLRLNSLTSTPLTTWYWPPRQVTG